MSAVWPYIYTGNMFNDFMLLASKVDSDQFYIRSMSISGLLARFYIFSKDMIVY